MKRDVNFSVIVRSRPLLCLAAVALVFIAGCSPVTAPSAPSPELDVTHYYLPISTKGMHYEYAVSATAPYVPSSGTLSMDMQGPVDTTPGNSALLGCLWSYKNYGTPTMWFYQLSKQQAVNYGIELSHDQYSDSWVDLQAPLSDTAHWTFTSEGEQIGAQITKYGATATINGKSYNDVLMVQFTGVSGTTGTEWFAKGVGLIFSHIERPGYGLVDYQLQTYFQK